MLLFSLLQFLLQRAFAMEADIFKYDGEKTSCLIFFLSQYNLRDSLHAEQAQTLASASSMPKNQRSPLEEQSCTRHVILLSDTLLKHENARLVIRWTQVVL